MGIFVVFLLTAVFSMLGFFSPSVALIIAPLPLVFGSYLDIVLIPFGTALAVYLGFLILAGVVGGRRR